jgi:hypothetical protein
MENVGDRVVKFLRGESWRTSGMFSFAAPTLLLAPMMVDCAAVDIKYLADELEWNARPVFLAQNPTCVETLLAKRRCMCKSLILLQIFDNLGTGRDGHIFPECPAQVGHFNK